jgi:hypothetical protein
MVEKILTGAYREAERGAFDFAVERQIPVGGWAPLGWLSKAGLSVRPDGLREVPHSGSPNYAERNIFDADGTLILTHGELSGAAELARNFATRYKHPLLHIDLARTSRFQAAENITAWIAGIGIQVLHVTGNGPGRAPELYQATRDILETVFRLELASEAMAQRNQLSAAPGAGRRSPLPVPRTIEDALKALTDLLSLKEKAEIGRTPERDLPRLYAQLGPYIERSLEWWRGNDALVASCLAAGRGRRADRNAPDEILIRTLWRRLKKDYGLRLIR